MKFKFQRSWYSGLIFISIMIILLIPMLIWELFEIADYFLYTIRFPEIDYISYLSLATVWTMIGGLEMIYYFIYYEFTSCCSSIILMILLLIPISFGSLAMYLLRTFWFHEKEKEWLRNWLEQQVDRTGQVPTNVRYFQQYNECCLMFEFRTGWYSNLPRERTVLIRPHNSFPLSCCIDLFKCQEQTLAVERGIVQDPPKLDSEFIYDTLCGEKLELYFKRYFHICQGIIWLCLVFVLFGLTIYIYYVTMNGVDPETGEPKRKFKPRRMKVVNPIHRNENGEEITGHQPRIIPNIEIVEEDEQEEDDDNLRDENSSQTFVTESYGDYKWKSLIKRTNRGINEADAVLHPRINPNTKSKRSEKKIRFFYFGNKE